MTKEQIINTIKVSAKRYNGRPRIDKDKVVLVGEDGRLKQFEGGKVRLPISSLYFNDISEFVRNWK